MEISSSEPICRVCSATIASMIVIIYEIGVGANQPVLSYDISTIDLTKREAAERTIGQVKVTGFVRDRKVGQAQPLHQDVPRH
jgi:hypothetical protein